MAQGNLAEVQRLIWRLVTAPEGVAQGLRREGDPEGRSLAGLLRGDARLDAAARLGVYANAYFYRIRDALRDDFGALHAALGEAPFHNLVTAYLIAHPPAHPSLRYAGRHLARFLSQAPEAAPYRGPAPFAGDLAALEWAIIEAFDAPDAPPVARDAVAAVAPERWGGLRFALTPSLQILTAGWPVHAMREAHDRGRKAGEADLRTPATTFLRVWRKRERVIYKPVPRRERDALLLLEGGADFGDLCGEIAAEAGEGAAPAEALALLERWLGDGLITGVRPG